MNRKNLFILLAVFTATISSCNDSRWLEPKPLSFYAPENVYIDEAGFNALLISMRKDLRAEHYDGRSPMVNEHAVSDLGAPLSLPSVVVKDFASRLTPSGDGGAHDFPGKLFNLAYNSIKTTNVLVSRIDHVKWQNESLRNRLLAGALFYRAYWYYRLVNSYGDVPFIGAEVTGPKLDFYTHSRWAILDKLIADLKWAVEWLPETAVAGAETRAAAGHLLAKVALAAGDFDQAIQAASQVIGGRHRLMTDRFGIHKNDVNRNVIWDLHRPENMNDPVNTETLFAVVDRHTDPTGARTVEGNVLARAYNPAWWQNGRDSEGKDAMVLNGAQYDTLFEGNAQSRPTQFYLYEIWDFKNDIRRKGNNWVEWYQIRYNNPSSVDFGKPVNRDNYPIPEDTLKHSYSFPHYKTYIPEQLPTVRPMGGHGDMYIFRLAETHLIRAEAYFWKGDLSSAAQDINVVRGRAKALPVAPSEVTIDYIFDERARELFAEEPRHGEMVRASYLMAKANLNGYSLEGFDQRNWFHDRVMEKNWFFKVALPWGEQVFKISPHNALWPVPETIIAANTLGVINQNLGYLGAEKNLPALTTIE
jgi:hypothetical protein